MTTELEQTLQKRLDEANAIKEGQLAKIHELNTTLQQKLKVIPMRPRETVKELDEKAKELECKRTGTSISLAEERQILKEINDVKTKKIKVEEFNRMDSEVQEIKKQLSGLRGGMSEIFAASNEIIAALEKIALANRLECAIDELTEKKMVCPKSRLGNVIGKNGSKIKQIQDGCKVSIQVEEQDITIIGSEAAIERATRQIDNIIRAVEEEIELEKLLVDYFTSKYVHVLRKLQQEYTDSFVDIRRSSGKLVIEGSPENIAEIKAKIFGIDIVSKKKVLVGREMSIVMGKKGATIERLRTEHMISIELSQNDDAESNAVFVGPPVLVEAALSNVETLLYNHREVDTTINISRLMKRILLAEGGKHIKAMQANLIESIPDGHCFVNVKADHSTKDGPEAIVKAKQVHISNALQFVIDALKELEKLTVKSMVDPYVGSRIIGRGGETIKKITEGKPFFLEVDKATGELSFGATSAEGLEELKRRVEELIDNNSFIRVKADSNVLKRQYRELARSEMKHDLNGICWFDIDEADSCYIIRGKKEDLEKGKILLDEFISKNQIAELPITEEDLEALLNGGKQSKITKFAEEMGVNLYIDRITFDLIVRGTRDNVDEAARKIDQFLNGDHGFSVLKVTLSEQVVGVVIGRGGKTRKELERKHEGVTIAISKAHVVTIRGPSQAASSCRVEIAKMVASARVTQSISVSNEQKISLEKKEYTKKILQQTPVSLTTTNDKIVARGTFYDVRDAVSLLNEMLTGEYKTFVELDAPQFSKVRSAMQDPSHFDRIETACGAKVELDLTAGSISISGKRSQVKRAKDQLYGLLDFLLVEQFSRIKISKPLFMSVGKASLLAEMSAEAGGVTIFLDRDLSLVVIRSIDEEKVKRATVLVKEKIKEAERLAYVFEISSSDSWIIPIMIGKKGENVSLMRKKYRGCKIDISKESRTIAILGETVDIVQEVREAFVAAMDKARSENLFVAIPNTDVSYFLGKGGSHVKELSAEYGVTIQSIKKGNGTDNFKISGESSKVKAAKEAVDSWLLMREDSNVMLEMTLEREKDIGAILGQEGVVARSIEEEFKCRFDVDKKTLVVKIRGPSEDQRKGALNKMKELIEASRLERLARELSAKEESDIVHSGENQINETGPVENLSPISSIDEEVDSCAKDIDKSDQFPSKPVGVASKQPKHANGKKKEVDESFDEGTEAGKNLFALLTSEW